LTVQFSTIFCGSLETSTAGRRCNHRPCQPAICICVANCDLRALAIMETPGCRWA